MPNTKLRKHSKECKHEFTGYAGGLPYFKRMPCSELDGIGRMHWYIAAECDHCEKHIFIGMMHEPKGLEHEALE